MSDQYNTNLVPPQSSHEDSPYRSSLWGAYRSVILDAYHNRKIFQIFGHFPTLRTELLNRGWLEKLPQGRFPKIQNMDDETISKNIARGNEFEAVAISRLLRTYPAYFIWQDKSQNDFYTEYRPYRNIIRRDHTMDFTTKTGLIGCAEQEMWYFKDGVSGMSYPRFYRLGLNEEQDAFIRDYLLTQCVSLASFVKESMSEPHKIYDFDKGNVPITVLTFAMAQLKKYCLDMESEQMVSSNVGENIHLTSEWKHFLFFSNEILHSSGKFRGAFRDLLTISRSGEIYLKKIYDKNPNLKWDGHKNIWILKPAYQCRGNGIVVRYLLEDILSFCAANAISRYIAQKYIERPLLVYNTKFDIRQYMLLTIGDKLIRIWLYKDCYLKFSGQEFNLDDMNESIHLTNNTVQRKYKNSRNRDSRLPVSNMWSLDQFKDYLKSANILDSTWETKIFNGFKRNLIAVVMASMEETYIQPNAFELYGCDFMLDEQFNPVLIEINSAPDMSASTEVTARLCPQVLKDVIKVVVDFPKKPFSSTGLFELVFEQNYKGYSADSRLTVSGHAMQIQPYRSHRSPPNKMPIIKKTAVEKKAQIEATSSKGVVMNRYDAPSRKAAAAVAAVAAATEATTSSRRASEAMIPKKKKRTTGIKKSMSNTIKQRPANTL